MSATSSGDRAAGTAGPTGEPRERGGERGRRVRLGAGDGPRIAIVAGEASGDALGAQLIEAVRERLPGARFAGIAGPRMRAAGCETWHPVSELAVRGYVEVIRHLPRLIGIRRDVRRRVLDGRFPLFVGVDAPDFNLGLEARLRRHGVRTVHFVSPSIWAWRGERVAKIKAAVDRMLALFPFEPPIYERAGVPVTFVGHPFAARAPVRRDPLRARIDLKLDPARPVVALLPGSRVSELEMHAELFLQTAALLRARFRSPQFVAPLATRETRALFEAARDRLQLGDLPLTVLFGHAARALEAADVALVASGTATLEAMLYQCPHVITYRVHPFTARLVRGKLGSRFVGLPNVIAGRFVVPEILQEDAEPETLAQALGNLLADYDLRFRLESEFAALSASLRADTDARIGDAISGELRAAGVAC